MEKQQSTAKGFAILTAAGMINKILALLYVPVLTFIFNCYTGKANVGNGIYNAAYTIYLLVFVITNNGIPIAISKIVSEQVAIGNYKDSYRTLKISLIMLILLGVTTSIIMGVFSNAFATYGVHVPEASLSILALSPTLIFTSIACAFRGYFQGKSNMTPTAISQIIEQFLNTILTIIFAWIFIKYGAHYVEVNNIVGKAAKLKMLEFASAGGTIGTSAGAFGSACFLSFIFLKNKTSIINEIKHSTFLGKRMHSKEIAKKILVYAFPITIGIAAIYICNMIDTSFTQSRLIVAGFSSFDAKGMYGVLGTQYQKLLNIPLAISAALAATVVPSVSAAYTKKDTKLLYQKINESFKIILIITIPSAVGLGVLAEPIIGTIFPSNIDGIDLMMMGSSVLVLTALVQIQTSVLQGMGKTYIPAINIIIGLCFKIVINYNLIATKFFNIKGAIVGSIACYIIAMILNHIMIKRYTGIKLKHKNLVLKPLISSTFMGIAIFITYKLIQFPLSKFFIHDTMSRWVSNILISIVSIGVGVVVFGICIIYIKGIRTNDFLKIPKGSKILSLIKKIKFLDKRLS